MSGTSIQIDREALAGEVARYLAAVDAFRDAGCEVTWRREARGRARRAWTESCRVSRSRATSAT